MASRRARLLALVRDVLRALRGHDLALYAAGLTFYASIAVVPLLLIAVSLTTLLVGDDTVTALGARLADYVPENLGLAAALEWLTRVGPDLGVASVLAALVPATTYGEGLARAFDRVARREQRAPGLRGRLRGLLLLPALPLVVTLGLGGVAVLPDLVGSGGGAQALGVYATFWIGWVSSSALVALVYRTFSEDRLPGRALFWGTASTGSFLTGMSLGWVLILELGVQVGQAYGGSVPIATAVLASLYLYLVQVVLLVGYVLTRRLAGVTPGARAGS